MAGFLGGYEVVEALALEAPAPVSRSYRDPAASENPNGGWFVRTSIKESDTGLLAGKTVAIKDSIMVAGLPMINGSNLLDGFVPDTDAVVVTRILAAGGEIIGKTHCEYLCLSGGSHTNARAVVHNAHKRGYTPGGSSTGSGAVVAGGEVDMALGADQAGSIRIPASFSGIVGLKPTFGLVPYTGIAPIEATFDHVGPMTRTVADNALLLQVLAGPDGSDPRQKPSIASDYRAKLGAGVAGLRIGVVKEGVEMAGTEPDVAAGVRASFDVFRAPRRDRREISIPMHTIGGAIWAPIGLDGLTGTVIAGNGFGISRLDTYPDAMMRLIHDNKAGLADAPANVKLFLMLSTFVKKQVGHSLYGKAINAAKVLRAAYDEALSRYDLLLMPTTPMKATPIPGPDAPIGEYVQRAGEMLANTSPFDVTHHPAISIPCGFSGGLPVGLMLVGKHYDEATIYQAAAAYEATGAGTATI